MKLRLLFALSFLVFAIGCGGGGNATADADPNAPDADPFAPDADPNAPDADPNAADADPGNCTGGLIMCGVSCVDIDTDRDNCGGCNSACGASQACIGRQCVSGANGLVISEVHSQPPTYFELYNGTNAAIDLTGYLVQWAGDSGANGSLTVPTYLLQPGEYVVFSEGSTVSEPGYVALGSSVNWVDSIAVILRDNFGVGVDFVRTGASAVTPPSGTGWTGANANNPSSAINQSLVRNVFIADSDTSGDWTLTATGSPGQYCGVPGQCGDACADFGSDRSNCGQCGLACSGGQICVNANCTGAFANVWISEYRRYPRPSVELHNPTGATVDLTGYQLQITQPGLSYTMPARTIVPGGFLTIYMGDGDDDATTLFMGKHASFGPNISIALHDVQAVAKDFVRFGTSNTSAPSGIFWFGSNVPAPIMDWDRSAQRNLSVLDSDAAADWKSATPSTPSTVCLHGQVQCAGVCVNLEVNAGHCGSCGNSVGAHEACIGGQPASAGKVVISELYAWSISDRFEIHNGTGQAIDLASWSLDFFADGSGATTFLIPPGVTIEAGGFLVFHNRSGTTDASNVYMNAGILWTDHIAVTISDQNGSPIDFVRTGASTVMPPPGTNWNGANVPNPVNTRTVERIPYAADTDTSADWRDNQSWTASSYCAGSETMCGGECVRVFDDALNCGACGNQCRTGSTCYQNECVDEGTIRLQRVGSYDGIIAGRVEAFWLGRWRAIRASTTLYFNNIDAAVVCRQLGFTSGSRVATSSSCSGCPTIGRFQCTGEEARLMDCPYTYSTGGTWSGPVVVCTYP